jgi:hypothetical protein
VDLAVGAEQLSVGADREERVVRPGLVATALEHAGHDRGVMVQRELAERADELAVERLGQVADRPAVGGEVGHHRLGQHDQVRSVPDGISNQPRHRFPVGGLVMRTGGLHHGDLHPTHGAASRPPPDL